MKRWIVAASVTVVAVLISVFAIPSAVGATYALWNTTAAVGTSVTSGTWAATPPDGGIIVPDNPATTTLASSSTWRFTSPVQFCADVTLTGTSTQPQPWSIKVKITGAPFFGIVSDISTNGTAATVTGPDSEGYLHFSGPTTHNLVSAGGSAVVAVLCKYSAPEPPIVAASPSTYTVSSAWLSDAGVTNTCIRVTVTGSSSQFFYTGYEAYFDWAGVLAAKYGAGTTAYNDRVAITPKVRGAAAVGPGNNNGGSGGGSATLTARGGTTYSVHGTGTWTSGVRTGVSNTIDLCTS